MIFSFVTVVSLVMANVASTEAARVPLYTPSRISYSDLISDGVDSHASFLHPLVTDGIISVTGIPDGFRELKRDVLLWLHAFS